MSNTSDYRNTIAGSGMSSVDAGRLAMTAPLRRLRAVRSTSMIQKPTRMWANAQRDGRSAEHRWRPLFNAAKFGRRPLLDAVQ